MRTALLLLSANLVVGRSVVAQAMMIPPGLAAQANFGGCVDNLGTPVPSVPAPGLNDIAISTIAILNPASGPTPVILFRPDVFQLPTSVQRFIYFHECAHHASGQVVRALHGQPITFVEEQIADCWAVVSLVQSGEFHVADIQLLQATFAPNPGNPTHLPGPIRAANFVACLQQAGVTPQP